MNLNAKTAAIVIGVIFLAVGILGFFPNPLVSPTGLFAVNTVHNLIHIVSGLVPWPAPMPVSDRRWR